VVSLPEHHPAGSKKLNVIRIGGREATALFLIGLGSTGGLYWFLRRFTDSTVPLGDSLTTAMSLVAQYMLSRKHIENWYVWITADIIYIALYAYKQLYLTGLLYLIFMIMCIMGAIQWKKSLASESADREAEAVAT